MRIGFVDHHLNNFHANKFLALLHGPLADLGARVTAAWESDPTGDDWCEKNAVRRLEGAAGVAAACDAVVVLAPDNIEAHLALCRQVLPAGKPTLVDKFLAPTRAHAAEILNLSGHHGAPVFSASSLRFAVEIEAALAQTSERPREAYARGMGEWTGYGVHTLALIQAALGGGSPARVIDTGTGGAACVTVEFAGGARGWADVRAAENQWEAFPWSFGFRTGLGTGSRYVTGTIADYDGFYANLMRRAVEFFRTGQSPISAEEMLGTVAVLEGAEQSRRAGGEWTRL